MGDRRRKTCQICRRHADEVGPISWTGKCGDCGPLIFIANLEQLRAHAGPYFQHHRRACVAAFGGVLVDDLEALLPQDD